jgi:hypothetical protein
MAKRKTIKKARVGTLTDFAKTAKITKQMVSKLKTMGVLKGALIEQPGKKRVLVDIDKALKFYNERMDPNFKKETRVRRTPDNKKNGATQAKSGGQSFVDARSISEQYKAAKLKLEYEINKELWLKKSDVTDKAFRAARLMRDTFQNIPSRISALVAAESDQAQCYRIINDELKEALNEYVRQLKGLAKGGTA